MLTASRRSGWTGACRPRFFARQNFLKKVLANSSFLYLDARMKRTSPRRSATRILTAIAVTAGCLFMFQAAQAADSTWNGGGGNNNWNNSGNWNALPATNGTDGLLFAGNTRLTPNNDFTGATFNKIQFLAGAGAFVLDGNAITLSNNPYIRNLSSVEQTINLNIVLNTSTQLFATTADLTINGKISGTGGISINTTNWVSLNGENTYSGGTSLASGGHLRLGNATAVGTGLFTVTGTDLKFASGIGTFYAGGFAGSGAVALTDEAAQGVTLVINGGSDASRGAAISGSGGLVIAMTGGAKQTLTGANTYTGGTRIESGTLELGSASGNLSASGALTINGGTLSIQRANAVKTVTVASLNGTGGEIVGNTGTALSTFIVNTTGNDAWGGALKNGDATLAFTKQGSGSLTLNGASTYTGATTVSAGTLIVNGSLGNTAVSVANNATLGGQGGTIAGSVTLGNTAAMQFSLLDENEINLTLNSLAIGANANLKLSLGTETAIGTKFTLISGSHTGSFSVLNGSAFDPNNFSLTYASVTYDLQLVYGADEIYVRVIPEPGISLLLLSGVAALLARRRRNN